MAGYRSASARRNISRNLMERRPPLGTAARRARGEPTTEATTPRFGASHIVAFALVLLDMRIVHRATLRALLPEGARRRRNSTSSDEAARLARGAEPAVTKNPVSELFQKALWRFDAEGWISRGHDFVLVRDGRALLDWALTVEWPSDFTLNLEAAEEVVRRSIRDEHTNAKFVEQRRQELIRIKHLMEQGMGYNWSGRGSVRLLPHSKVL